MSAAPFTYMPFAQVPTRAVFDKRLTESDLRVLTYLASLTVNSNHRAWMAQQKMADRLGIDVSTVKRSLRRLRRFDYISVESNGRKGPARRNRYYILHEPYGISDDRMWDAEGNRVTFDGPSTQPPVGGTGRPQPDANGGTAAPIMGAPDAPQEIQERDRNSLRENPYGHEQSSRDSQKPRISKKPRTATSDATEPEDWQTKREQQRLRMQAEIAKEEAAKKKRMAAEVADVVGPIREGAS